MFARRTIVAGTALLSILLIGCQRGDRPSSGTDTTTTAADSTAPKVDSAASAAGTTLPISDTRIEIDVNARQLKLFTREQLTGTYPVAVGSAEWPTKTGEWNVVQVVWNPEWIPPDESWAEERKPRKPGDPANPLGEAQLVYDPPRTIHGTNEPSSIGRAVSHGSIRMTNATVKQLARQLMEATGAGKDEAWYQDAQRNRTVKQIVDLPQLVPIRVY